jgi:RNA polymerase sigma-70 factor (ECF subfamily)
LVHDVFVSLPSILHKFEPGRSLGSFLLSIAANRARHHVRAASRRRRLAERLADEPAHAPESPEQDVERRRLARALQQALDLLPIDLRVAFVLCEVEAVGSREAAEILGVPEGTVRRRLFQARERLRAQLVKGESR